MLHTTHLGILGSYWAWVDHTPKWTVTELTQLTRLVQFWGATCKLRITSFMYLIHAVRFQSWNTKRVQKEHSFAVLYWHGTDFPHRKRSRKRIFMVTIVSRDVVQKKAHISWWSSHPLPRSQWSKWSLGTWNKHFPRLSHQKPVKPDGKKTILYNIYIYNNIIYIWYIYIYNNNNNIISR